MIGDLLPAGVHAAEAFDDAMPGDLFPAEEAVIARAVDKRRREFTTARRCARQALAALGHGPVAILPGERGAPGWPPGVVGAITHCAGYRAAVVADATRYTTLGIDAEPNEPLPPGVLEAVASPGEQEWIAARLRAAPHVRWDRLLFSAKESVYKAWYPLARRWLDFTGAELTVDAVAGTFHARILKPGPVEGFTGRWLARKQLVVTAIAVPAG